MKRSTSGFTFKRSSENCRVPGFSFADNYAAVVRRASRALYPEVTDENLKKVIIVIGPGSSAQHTPEWGGGVVSWGMLARNWGAGTKEQNDIWFLP